MPFTTRISAAAQHVAATFAALGVIYGVFVGVIHVFGGHVPPYETFADAADLKSQMQNDEKEAQAFELDALENRVVQASLYLRQHPNDPVAMKAADKTQRQYNAFIKLHPDLAAQFGL